MSSDSSGPADGDGDTGYVHRPEGVEEADSASGSEPYTGEPEGEGFGKQGWLLVAGVVVCFLVIPGAIYLYPTAPAQLGWTFFATFLALPLVPAILLGLLAVWSMQAAS
ncbi:MAG: hypothetical protein U9O06_13725 [Euryarchaeota archaeon]|nr:hypothetical protein [Euryarchaeota archaeon]